MPENRLEQKLKSGKVVLGLGNMYPAPGIIEGMCTGWDFVWIDNQHGQHNVQTSLYAVQAAASKGLDTIIRSPGDEYGIVGPLMDLAPSALMIPMVDTPEEAQRVVEVTQFPPLGKRSYGGRRVIDLHGRDYYKDLKILVIAQIETMEAVENVEAISNTEGIDMVFFGPDDAKVRMGLPINTGVFENEELLQALRHTAQAAQKAGIFCGTTAPGLKPMQTAVEAGCQLVVGGGDIVFLRTMAAAALEELRGGIPDSKKDGNAGAY